MKNSQSIEIGVGSLVIGLKNYHTDHTYSKVPARVVSVDTFGSARMNHPWEGTFHIDNLGLVKPTRILLLG